MKELKDYIHLYIGCKVLCGPDKEGVILVGVDESEIEPGRLIAICKAGDVFLEWYVDDVKLVLRPLDSMTDSDENAIALALGYGAGSKAMGLSKRWFLDFWKGSGNAMLFGLKDSMEAIIEMLKLGFDLFDLHAAGLCVYENEIMK